MEASASGEGWQVAVVRGGCFHPSVIIKTGRKKNKKKKMKKKIIQ